MRRFLSLFKKASPTRLGRWNPKESQDTIHLKVDWANHDCCGGPSCTTVPMKKRLGATADLETNRSIHSPTLWDKPVQ